MNAYDEYRNHVANNPSPPSLGPAEATTDRGVRLVVSLSLHSHDHRQTWYAHAHWRHYWPDGRRKKRVSNAESLILGQLEDQLKADWAKQAQAAGWVRNASGGWTLNQAAEVSHE